MKDCKVQTGLRIPQDRYDELRMMAEKSGVSLNSIILFLVDVGLSAVNLGVEQSAHSLPHSPKDTDE